MSDPTTGYAPGEQRPLAAYAVLSGGFFAALAGALVVARAAGRDIDRPTLLDVVLHGLAIQKVSRLVDPRKGRGLYSTFHARVPLFRWPLDHVFHSDSFRLVALRRLPYVGSDHFPVFVALSHEPPAAAEQEAPSETAEDLQEARETVQEGKAQGASTG